MAIGKTNEEFIKEVYNLVGNEYTFLENYINNKVKIEIRHNKCGNEYYVSPNRFLSGRRCPYCSGKMKKTTESFAKEVREKSNGEYELKSDYINNETKVKMLHKKCGKIYKVIPYNFSMGKGGCPYCDPHKKLTREEIIKRIYELVGDEYTLLSKKYKSSKTKMKIRHNKCEMIYRVTMNMFINCNKRCPYCRYYRSKGEEEIEKWLNKYEIKYIKQYKFDDCKYKDKLRFDFMIYDEFGGIFCLIEYDGSQYFHKNKNYGKTKEEKEKIFEYIKKKDRIKDEYCKRNGYYLYRISYLDNIEDKLKNEIFKDYKDYLGIER